MPATLIDGNQIASGIRNEVRDATERLRTTSGIVPGLAFILIGDNPASQVYVRAKEKACGETGFHSITERRPAATSQDELLALIQSLNANHSIHGILVQLPLPPQIDEGAVIEAIDYRKDVDGFHPVNVGKMVSGRRCFLPCTPSGVHELLIRSGNDPGGKHVIVVGRSNIVGRPLANMLSQKHDGANAIVTLVHTGARDIGAYTREGDIVIAALGRPGAITGAMLKPGCVVIDVGINRVPDSTAKRGYRISGDVDFPSVLPVAGSLTPVPGGVGPMTIAMLLRNTLQAATPRS